MAREYLPFTVRGDGLNDREGLHYEYSVLGMLHSFDAIQTSRAPDEWVSRQQARCIGSSV
jgi:hypothetical protein